MRTPGRKAVVFFQSQICDSEPGSQRFGHIADVPWFVRDAGDLLSVFWVPEDKTIERSVLFQPAAFSCCGKPFGELHMDGRAGYIQSKSALVLTCSWLCNERTSCKKLLLSLVGTISGNCPQVQTASVYECLFLFIRALFHSFLPGEPSSCHRVTGRDLHKPSAD